MVTLEFPCQVETSTGKHQGVHMDTGASTRNAVVALSVKVHEQQQGSCPLQYMCFNSETMKNFVMRTLLSVLHVKVKVTS